MGKLFYRGTTEHILRQKTYSKDKRKKVKLVSLVDRRGQQWYYLFIGTKMITRTPGLNSAIILYNRY